MWVFHYHLNRVLKTKFLLFIVFVLANNFLPAQITFDKGYFIDNSGRKTKCLIKNLEWKNNPKSFEYKLSENGQVMHAGLDRVKEFGIYGDDKYIRAKVKIDRSSSLVNRMSHTRKPEFHEEVLFLKVLVEGGASLYEYKEDNLVRYFYRLPGTEIKQLVHKKYIKNDNIYENNDYKNQLYNALKCPSFSASDFKNLRYNKQDLEKIFVMYNKCKHANYVVYRTRRKSAIKLNIKAGTDWHRLKADNAANSRTFDFGSQINGTLGLEIAYVLPYNRNTWRIFVAPTFQYFKAEARSEVQYLTGSVQIASIDYKSIMLPVGLRYMYFLDNRMALFADAAYVFDFPLDAQIELRKEDGSLIDVLTIDSAPDFSLSIGFAYKDRYTLALRYFTKREILNTYTYWASDYQTVSVVLGINLFRKQFGAHR